MNEFCSMLLKNSCNNFTSHRAKQPCVSVEVNLRTPAWRVVERALASFDLEVIGTLIKTD